ncbi:MAG: YdcF family protein [Gammaproteobacteria bacterium]|nr:YdcF family protein [Gammaproteobacteria bacterium]
MEHALRRAVEALIMPPTGPLLLLVAGWALSRFRRRLGRALAGAGLVTLYLAAIPLGAAVLSGSLQRHPALPAQPPPAQAIVVLSAGRHRAAPEYGGDTIDAHTLERVRYAARLHRRTGAPILVTGGRRAHEGPSMAALMARALEQDFGVEARWIEPRARNTWENATRSAALLAAEGIARVYLVTHAWHTARSMAVFEQVGLAPVAAPTAFYVPAPGDYGPAGLVPGAEALYQTRLALHEWVGRAWYALRY